jgi:hypothetical protein
MNSCLSSNQMMLMLELCTEAEHRCDDRLRTALGRSEFHRADSELQLKEKYTELKRQLFDSMKQQGTSMDDLHEMPQRLPVEQEPAR